jgi:hypothetical protein
MGDDERGNMSDDAAKAVIQESPLLRSVLSEMLYLDALKSGQVSPVSAAIRVRQIRNARMLPADGE